MSIPFSERVHNWVSSLVAIWPLLAMLVGGTVYGNSETVKRWVHGDPVEIPQGETPEIVGGSLEAQMKQAVMLINKKLAELEKRDGAFASHTNKHDAEQDERLEQLEALVQ